MVRIRGKMQTTRDLDWGTEVSGKWGETRCAVFFPLALIGMLAFDGLKEVEGGVIWRFPPCVRQPIVDQIGTVKIGPVDEKRPAEGEPFALAARLEMG